MSKRLHKNKKPYIKRKCIHITKHLYYNLFVNNSNQKPIFYHLVCKVDDFAIYITLKTWHNHVSEHY